MTAPSINTSSGYTLEKVYANNLAFAGYPVSDTLEQGDGRMSISWDWDTQENETFRITLGVSIPATKVRPESVEVKLCGVFRFAGDARTVPILDFVQTHAPVLLMPFVREAISSLTARGLHGPLVLPPLHMLPLLNGFKQAETTGFQQLAANPELAKAFGVTPLVPASAHAEQG